AGVEAGVGIAGVAVVAGLHPGAHEAVAAAGGHAGVEAGVGVAGVAIVALLGSVGGAVPAVGPLPGAVRLAVAVAAVLGAVVAGLAHVEHPVAARRGEHVLVGTHVVGGAVDAVAVDGTGDVVAVVVGRAGGGRGVDGHAAALHVQIGGRVHEQRVLRDGARP